MSKTCALAIAILGFVSVSCAQKAEQTAQPSTVIITAGQSNTDGRVLNSDLPEYIKQNKYQHCLWSYGSEGKLQTDGFELFWPKIGNPSQPDKWAYDAVAYYWLEQALQKDFYVVKWTLGGTAIDPSVESNSQKYWCPRPEWLEKNASTLTGGKSLLLSFTEEIGLCIDNYLSKLPDGFEIKAFLWHQGESDCKAGENYHDNLKMLVEYVRSFLVEKTGNEKYKELPFIFGTVAHANSLYDPQVEAAMKLLAQEEPNFYLIDMADAELQSDGWHFTAPEAERLGIEVYNQLVELGIAGSEAKKISH